MIERQITRRYVDPLDAIWLSVAKSIGLRVERSSSAFASTDGKGLLLLGTQETLDADDCLAQMIFHELCHALVQEPHQFSLPDWGLDNQSNRDVILEHACLQLQLYLASQYGLREFLAPTTDFRSYYDALTVNSIDETNNEASEIAKKALSRVVVAPFSPWIQKGLEATSSVLAIVNQFDKSHELLESQDQELFRHVDIHEVTRILKQHVSELP